MACISSALPAAIAAQLSYRIGLSPLPAQLTLGLSVNRHVFPNYVDLFPCEQNQGTPMVKYTPISGLSFLDELIDAALSPEGSALLAKIDNFYAQLDRHFPGLSERYRQKYGSRYEIRSDNHARLMPIFYDICRKNGMMSSVEENFAYLHRFESRCEAEQLRFF